VALIYIELIVIYSRSPAISKHNKAQVAAEKHRQEHRVKTKLAYEFTTYDLPTPSLHNVTRAVNDNAPVEDDVNDALYVDIEQN